MVVIAMGGHNVGEKKLSVLSDIGLVLTITFAAEALFKIFILGTRDYFKSR